jgi:hypothetical protein
MKKYLVLAVGMTMVAAASAQAQTSCAAGVPTSSAQATENSRQQASDLFQYLAPQLSAALAGGSPTLGQSGTLGGLGHFSVGVRGTAVQGSLPDVANFPVCYTGRYSAVLPTSSKMMPGGGADAAIGLFKGLPLALTNVGAVDLLLSATYLPEFDNDNIHVKLPDGSLKIGYGARVGLLSESIIVPGVSLSFMRRELPTVNLTANSGASDSLFVTDLRMKITSWRIEASKSLLLFGIFGGVGKDTYESSVDRVSASVLAGAFGRANATLDPSPSQDLTRTNIFGGVKMNLLFFKLAAEVGRVSGGDVTTFNTFSGSEPDVARTYGSVGLRFGF